MHEEAASLASSVLKRIRYNDNSFNQESYDMMESAGMVFVQSLKELGRYIPSFPFSNFVSVSFIVIYLQIKFFIFFIINKTKSI